MKLLLHTCCAPCLCGVMPFVEGLKTVCFWFNPNIHPYTEYKARLHEVETYTRKKNTELIIKDNYGLREFLCGIKNNFEDRCGICYGLRFEECARTAAKQNFDAFGSTLMLSPYQDHEKIKETGEKYAELYGLDFFYEDFRKNFRTAMEQAREQKIYMQKYCGCIFSEEERYIKIKK